MTPDPTDRSLSLAFDRGTISVRGPAPALALLADDGLVFDARVGVHRVLASRYAAILDAARRAGLSIIDPIAARHAEPLAPARIPALRPYQADALVAWEVAGRRGIVDLPTGAGKTQVALAAVARMAAPAIVLVPTRVLLEQWVRRARESLGVEPAVHGDGDHEVGPLTVCTFESAFRRMDEFGDRFALLVVDEVHHFAHGARIEALETCTAPARLGLTATLPPSIDALARLDALVGPVVYQLRVPDLAGTALAPYNHLRIRVDLTDAERAAYDAAEAPVNEAHRTFSRAMPGGTWGDFVRCLVRSPGGRDLLARHRAARAMVGRSSAKMAAARDLARRHAGDRVLYFTSDNAAAYAVSRDLLIPAITCDIGRREREEVLDRFRAGAVRAIVSARVLNEGLDVPDASVGVVLGGSLGPGEHVQRVGRVLRPGPDKVARVYEVVATGTFEDIDSIRRRRALAA
jgi:superfamily II DNA or RNA helicase